MPETLFDDIPPTQAKRSKKQQRADTRAHALPTFCARKKCGHNRRLHHENKPFSCAYPDCKCEDFIYPRQ